MEINFSVRRRATIFYDDAKTMRGSKCLRESYTYTAPKTNFEYRYVKLNGDKTIEILPMNGHCNLRRCVHHRSHLRDGTKANENVLFILRYVYCIYDFRVYNRGTANAADPYSVGANPNGGLEKRSSKYRLRLYTHRVQTYCTYASQNQITTSLSKKPNIKTAIITFLPAIYPVFLPKIENTFAIMAQTRLPTSHNLSSFHTNQAFGPGQGY